MQTDLQIPIASNVSPPTHSLAQHAVWKRLFPHSTTQRTVANIMQGKKKDVEWISDLFKASLFRQKSSFNQLRTCQLSNKQTKILATLVPDEIIYFKDLNKKSIVSFVGVLLFADVSGFTALTEKYNTSGKGGTYRLTATLNAYIGAMVEVIYSHGGDVLKFSGDAFLAIWKVKHNDFIFHVVHKAIVCALFIQQTLGSYETDVKVLLRVKLAISAGNMIFSVIGDELCNHYIVCGAPVLDVKAAEHVCVSGDVVLSPSAWGHCSSHNYEFVFKDSCHVKVTGIVYNPGLIKKEVMQRFTPLRILLESRQGVPEKNTIADSSSSLRIAGVQQGNELNQSIMRPSVSEACTLKLGGVLRPFVIPPVVQQVDADQPLEYLSEMRQVTTMFVNLIALKIRPEVLVHLVDEAYTATYKIVRSSLGCVNKVTLFDKDITFLIIFGLRGCKHESESQNGLKCAYSVWKTLAVLENVKSVSAGVTTGMVYCGVVGHSQRREYTVIGAPVNKAARIMCAYPDRVTCDHSTFLYSKLPPDHFELQEMKELKGIDAVGNIYKYTEETWLMSRSSPGLIPLLGRQEIVSMFENMLNQWNENLQYRSLVLLGDAQVGKSRLLEELTKRCVKYNFEPISISLTSLHMSTSYFTIYQIFKQILGLNDTATISDRVQRIIKRIGEKVLRTELCYLNDILQVKFPHSAQYLNDSMATRKETSTKILQTLIHQHSQKFIFAIDNAQFIDYQSWELLTNLLLTNTVMVVTTMYNGRRAVLVDAAETFLQNEKALILQLNGLESKYMAPLACYYLRVNAVSTELENLLKRYGGGNPGWCQNFLTSLMKTGSLKIQERSQNEISDMLLVSPLLDMKSFEQIEQQVGDTLTETRISPSEKSTSAVSPSESRILSSKEKTARICAIQSHYAVNRDEIPETIDAMIMAVFDSLTPYEQVLLKCASVLGEIFSRDMLMALMHRPSIYLTAQAIKQLFEMQVWGCARSDSGGNLTNHIYQIKTTPSLNTYFETVVNCSCPVSTYDELSGNFPKYAFCQVLHFKIPLFRETTYDLLPNNQKKDFHARAVDFLENEDHKCFACGGKNLLSIPSEVFAILFENSDQKLVQTKHSVTRETNTEDCISDYEEHSDRESTSIIAEERSQSESESYSFFIEMSKMKDFRNCECPFVQFDAYQQLVYHCAAAGLKLKQIKFLIEQGAISITIGNNIQAIELLNAAKHSSENDIEESEIPRASQRLNFARIYMLLGQANLDLGNLEEAKAHLHVSIKKFGGFFPKSKLTACVFLPWQYSRLMMKRKFPHMFIPVPHDIISHGKASAFSHLTNVYMMEQKWLLAEVAALLSLHFAQKSNDLCELCGAYSNMMEVCHHHGRLKYNKNLEDTALTTVQTLYSGSEVKELLAVCHLHWATSISRLLRGELESSIKAGFSIIKISEQVCNNFVKLTVLPTLIQSLIMTHGLHEAADLLKILLFEAQQDIDKSSQIWYYALCLDIILDTGFTLEKSELCITYAQRLVKKYDANAILRDKASLQRLIVNMWVWCIRLHKEEDCKLWGSIAAQHIHIEEDDSFSNLLSDLRYLEGLLLYNVVGMKTLPQHMRFLHFTAISIMRKLEKIAETVNVIQPRFLHLKAYYFCTQNNKEKAIQILKDAWDKAEEQGNVLEVGWITHSFKLWNGILNSVDKDMWKDNIVHNRDIDWHEYTSQTLSHTAYSLPMSMHSS